MQATSTITVLALLAAALCAPPPARADEAALAARIQACAAEADATRRLACYDREAQALPAAPAPAARTAEQAFGLKGELARAEIDQRRTQARQLERLEARVTAITTRGHGERVFTLDNGQVWAEKTLNSSLRVKVGDTVKIEPASFGSFLLSGPVGRASRVNRLR